MYISLPVEMIGCIPKCIYMDKVSANIIAQPTPSFPVEAGSFV